MWKLTSRLVALTVVLSMVWFGHALLSGIAVPYQDPAPEQIAYERYHSRISLVLFVPCAVSWLATGMVVVVAAGNGLSRAAHA